MGKNDASTGEARPRGPLGVVATEGEVAEAMAWAQAQARELSRRIEEHRRRRGSYPAET